MYGQAFTHGLEGVDWILNDDNTYEQIIPEGFSSFSAYQIQALRWNDLGRAEAIGLATTSTPGNAQARQIAYVEYVIPYQITENIFPQSPAGILKFTDDEQYIIDNKYADINMYVEKMKSEFITGVTDIESGWDAYVAECEKMGLQDVLEVYQASFDRWNEALNALN